MEGVKLEFTPGALAAIASQAMGKSWEPGG